MDRVYTEAVRLSPEARLRMNQQAAKGLGNILLVQTVVLLLATMVVALWASWPTALSLLAGGLAYLLPSALVILQMLLRLIANRNASASALFLGEGIKIVGTLLLLWAIVWLMRPILVWPALLIGLVLVMKAYVFLLVFRKI